MCKAGKVGMICGVGLILVGLCVFMAVDWIFPPDYPILAWEVEAWGVYLPWLSGGAMFAVGFLLWLLGRSKIEWRRWRFHLPFSSPHTS